MIAVAYHFEDWMQHVGTPEPLTSMRRWTGDSKILGADTLFLIDKTTFKIAQYYNHTSAGVHYFSFDDFIEVEEKYPDSTIVYFEDKYFLEQNNIKGINIFDFEHPDDNVIYVVGPNFGSIEVLENRRDKTWVFIPGPSRYTLFADTVLTIALYDRMSKVDR